MRFYLGVLFSALLLFPAPTQAQAPQKPAEFMLRDKVAIKSSDGKKHNFYVELALTPRQQTQGLMFRTFIDDSAGMLFLFGAEAQRRFWMKNTLIPLDIIFIREDGTIHHIHKNAQPHDLSGAPSNGEVSAVLEINGGLSDKLGIKNGDRIVHPVFTN